MKTSKSSEKQEKNSLYISRINKILLIMTAAYFVWIFVDTLLIKNKFFCLPL